MVGGSIEIEIDGKKYKLSPFTLKDLGDFEDYIRSKKLNLYLKAGGNDPEVINKILTSPISRDELNSAFASEIAWVIKRSIEKTQSITDEELDKLLSLDNIDKILPIAQKILFAEGKQKGREMGVGKEKVG